MFFVYHGRKIPSLLSEALGIKLEQSEYVASLLGKW